MLVERLRRRQGREAAWKSHGKGHSDRVFRGLAVPEITPSWFGHLFRRTVGRPGGAMMIRPTAALVFSGLLLCAAPLAGCTDNAPPSGQPSFYIDLSQPGTVLDANAAQSMISGYRSNNGLGPLTIDPDLTR